MSAVVALRNPTPSPAAKPLSPARANLVAAKAAVEAARAEVLRLSEPANRLHEIKRALTTEQERFAALKAADDVLLGGWLSAGGVDGPRPAESEERAGSEQRIIALVRDVAAVEAVQPGLDQAVAEAQRRYAVAAAARDAAFWVVVAEAAVEFIDREFSTRVKAMLESEAAILSLFDVLRFSSAGGNGNPAHQVAELIGDRRQEAKRRIGAPRNSELGAKFLARLRDDPAAELV